VNLSTALNFFQSTTAAITNLPLGAHVIPVVILICGLLFWLAGGRFLKQLFILLGIASGAGLGAVFGPHVLPDQVGSIPGSYVAMGLGGVLGLIAALLAFRFSMALCGAVVLAAAGSLGVGVYLSRQPEALPVPLAESSIDKLKPGAAELTQTYKDAVSEFEKGREQAVPAPEGEASPSTLLEGPAADATRQFADEVWGETEYLWSATPERSRLLLFLGAAAGAIAGAAAGMSMPKRAAAVITAVLGAGLVLIAGGWLARAFDVPGKELLTERGPIGVLGVWGALALFGAIVQLRASAAKPKAAAPKPEPKAE